MQDAKDSFYEMLRTRITARNPERTVTVRGVLRPGVVVDENEAASVAVLPDCFHLRWVGGSVNNQCAVPVLTLQCDVAYATGGSAEYGGLDRGRALTAMDRELVDALFTAPQSCAKSSYVMAGSGQPAEVSSTRVWWSDPELGQATPQGERVSRVVRVSVMSLVEGTEQ